jgi:hypothetical protein
MHWDTLSQSYSFFMDYNLWLVPDIWRSVHRKASAYTEQQTTKKKKRGNTSILREVCETTKSEFGRSKRVPALDGAATVSCALITNLSLILIVVHVHKRATFQ